MEKQTDISRLIFLTKLSIVRYSQKAEYYTKKLKLLEENTKKNGKQ